MESGIYVNKHYLFEIWDLGCYAFILGYLKVIFIIKVPSIYDFYSKKITKI